MFLLYLRFSLNRQQNKLQLYLGKLLYIETGEIQKCYIQIELDPNHFLSTCFDYMPTYLNVGNRILLSYLYTCIGIVKSALKCYIDCLFPALNLFHHNAWLFMQPNADSLYIFVCLCLYLLWYMILILNYPDADRN